MHYGDLKRSHVISRRIDTFITPVALGVDVSALTNNSLATVESYCAVQRLAEEDLLGGATCLKENIEILEWFNSAVIDHKIDLQWS